MKNETGRTQNEKSRGESFHREPKAEHVSELGHCIHEHFNSISDVRTAEGSRVEMGAVLVGGEFCKVGTMQSSVAMCFALFIAIFLRYPQADNFDVRQVGWCKTYGMIQMLRAPCHLVLCCKVFMTLDYHII